MEMWAENFDQDFVNKSVENFGQGFRYQTMSLELSNLGLLLGDDSS